MLVRHCLLFRLAHPCWHGCWVEDEIIDMENYAKTSFRMVASIAGALLYLVSPLDIVPDWVPCVGLFDDALVRAAIFALSRRDLEEYMDRTSQSSRISLI